MSPFLIPPGLDDARIHPAQAELAPDLRIGHPEGVESEPCGELRAAGMGLLRDLDDRCADGKPRPRLKVVDAEIEVHVQLIAG